MNNDTRFVTVAGTPFRISVPLCQHLQQTGWADCDGTVWRVHNTDPNLFRWVVQYEQEYRLPAQVSAMPELHQLAHQLQLTALTAYLQQQQNSSQSSGKEMGFRASFQGLRKSFSRKNKDTGGRRSASFTASTEYSSAGGRSDMSMMDGPHNNSVPMYDNGYPTPPDPFHNTNSTNTPALATDGIHHEGRKNGAPKLDRRTGQVQRAKSWSRLKDGLPRTHDFRSGNKNNNGGRPTLTRAQSTNSNSDWGSSRSLSERGQRRGLMAPASPGQSKRKLSLLPKASSFRRKNKNKQQQNGGMAPMSPGAEHYPNGAGGYGPYDYSANHTAAPMAPPFAAMAGGDDIGGVQV